MLIVHMKDGTDVGIASGIDAGPWINGNIIDNAFIEIRNSSQRVALFATADVKWIDIPN